MTVFTDRAGSFWYLEGFIDSSRERWRTVIDSLPLGVGREQGASLQLFSSGVSNRHAELFRRDRGLWLRDLGSTNGTRLNFAPLEAPAPLREGDVIHFADLEFRVGVYRPAGSAAQPLTQTLTPDELSAYLREHDAEFGELLDKRAVYPLFQPVVSLADGGIVGFELLSRGTLKGAEVTPVELFSIAERLGRELELSELFRTTGLRHAARLGGRPLIFLNTHPAEISARRELLRSLAELRRRHRELRIVLEIHEAAMTEVGVLQQLRDELQQLEILMAFDDFGTGRSRLLELADVPPDYVKFDMGFVRNLDAASARRRETVESLVAMTRGSGIVPIAEGIETENEEAACRQVGFEIAQGYRLGLPTLVSELLEGG